LAWNRRFQKDGEWQEEPNFFDITCWKETAENVVESFRKGDRVLVSGRLEHSRWEDKKTGEKRSKVGVVADEVAGTTRWATVEMRKVEQGGGRSDDRGRGSAPSKRSQRDEPYPNEEPF
jgi:single-strand DNA-binding protein